MYITDRTIQRTNNNEITENAVFSPRRREGCGEGGFENSNFVNRVETPPFFYINRLQMFQLEEM